MTLDLSSLFQLFNLPSGRRLVAMRDALPMARKYRFDKLITHLEKSIVREREVLDLERRWRAASAGSIKDGIVPFDELKEVRIKAQNRLLSAVALVIDRYFDETPENAEARTELLTPIMDQHDVIHAYLRSGLKIRDIDPDTGELSEEIDLEQPDHIDIDPPPARA